MPAGLLPARPPASVADRTAFPYVAGLGRLDVCPFRRVGLGSLQTVLGQVSPTVPCRRGRDADRALVVLSRDDRPCPPSAQRELPGTSSEEAESESGCVTDGWQGLRCEALGGRQELHHPDLQTADGGRGALGPHEGPLGQNHLSYALHHRHRGGLREPQEAEPPAGAGRLPTLVTRSGSQAHWWPRCSGAGAAWRGGAASRRAPRHPTSAALPQGACLGQGRDGTALAEEAPHRDPLARYFSFSCPAGLPGSVPVLSPVLRKPTVQCHRPTPCGTSSGFPHRLCS